MSDPKRWTDETPDGDPFARELVLAGQRDALPSGQHREIWSKLAAAQDTPFDWFDATVISHHVTQQSKAALLAEFTPTEGAA